MRANLTAVLGTDTGIVVVGEAATADDTIALARRRRPAVILIDGGDGLHVLSTSRRLLADPELAATEILLLGRFERDADVLAALRIGIAGLIDRDVPPYELVRAVRTAASGAAFVLSSPTRSARPRPRPTRPEE
jgi:DNA-binding NarL/FixJ family response regulator